MFEWVWPVVCLGCGTEGARWCRACAPGPLLRPPSPSLAIEQAFAITRYEAPAGRALRRVKVDGDRIAAVALAERFAAGMVEAFPGVRPAAVVPAPSTLASRVRRGFSLGCLFAHAAARALEVPYRPVLRSRASSRLATLSAAARRHALQGRIRAEVDLPGLILLVDDVLTTGATADACAMELLGGSADQIVFAAFCVVPLSVR